LRKERFDGCAQAHFLIIQNYDKVQGNFVGLKNLCKVDFELSIRIKPRLDVYSLRLVATLASEEQKNIARKKTQEFKDLPAR
jgi:hypothetical protein